MNLKSLWGGLPGGIGITFIDKKSLESLKGYDERLYTAEDTDLTNRAESKAFLHMDGYSSSRRFATNGVTLKRTIEIFLGINKKTRDATICDDKWYKPTYRDICYEEEDLSQPRDCFEKILRYLCPEKTIVLQDQKKDL